MGALLGFIGFSILCFGFVVLFNPRIVKSSTLTRGHGARIMLIGMVMLLIGAWISNAKKSKTASEQSTMSVSQTVPQAASQVQAAKKVEISETALDYLTKKDAPKLYGVWGQKGFNKINGLFDKAVALVVNNSNVCRKITMVYLAVSESSPKKGAVIYVDCDNYDPLNKIGDRYYITESDIKNGVLPQSETQKRNKIESSESEFIFACRDVIQKNMTYPSSFDLNAFDSYAQPEGQDKVRVVVSYDAKNDYGNVVPLLGKCKLDLKKGEITFEVTGR